MSTPAKAMPTPATQQVGLAGVRFGGDATTTRVVLDLDATVSGKLVKGNGAHDIVIALPPLLSTGPLQGKGAGLVTSWTLNEDALGARLTLEVAPGATIVHRFVLPPPDDGGNWRYVIDIAGPPADPLSTLLDPSAPRLASNPPPATAAPAVAPASPPSGMKTVVQASPPPVSAPAAGPPVLPPRIYRVATAPATPAPQTSPAATPSPKPIAQTPAPPQPPPPRPAVVAAHTAPARPAPERGTKIVVIDAGHGGHDTGAQSLVRNEKDITLAAAISLREHLLKMGHYKVVMTREDDVFIPLETRVQIARRAGADLFISLHADSAGSDPTPHGASVYTLSDSGQTRVNNVLGPQEWFAHVGNGQMTPDVREILLDLTQRTTRNRSSEFAAKLLGHIGDRVDLLPRSHRDAGYFVLLAPDVPAVLLEMGFITNPGDQMRLTDPAQRDRLTSGIAEAIDDYFYGARRLEAGF